MTVSSGIGCPMDCQRSRIARIRSVIGPDDGKSPSRAILVAPLETSSCKAGGGTGKVDAATTGGPVMIQELLPQAERIAAKLKARGETISVAESSTAGLISAALLAIAGASAYFLGGAVVYTRQSRTELLAVSEQELTGITPSTEAYALLFARKIRGKLATTWAVGETGTAGPTGSRYGHAAGHSCIAVIGPNGERSITVETGNSDRLDNMRAFSIAALDLLEKGLS